MSWWASPAEPRRHALTLNACGTVRLRGGAVLVTRRARRFMALEATTLAGTRPIVLRRAPAISDADLSGERVAWREDSCQAGHVRSAVPRRERRIPSGCVIRALGGRTLRMDARGRVRVAVRCAEGCDGSLHALRCGGRRCIARPAPVRLAAGRRKVLRLRLTARTQRLGRRRGARGLPAALKSTATHVPTVLVTRRIVAARRR